MTALGVRAENADKHSACTCHPPQCIRVTEPSKFALKSVRGTTPQGQYRAGNQYNIAHLATVTLCGKFNRSLNSCSIFDDEAAEDAAMCIIFAMRALPMHRYRRNEQ